MGAPSRFRRTHVLPSGTCRHRRSSRPASMSWTSRCAPPRSSVVDLETTGGSAAADGITEIGAVKVRGGEVLGEFQTLVHPGQPITPVRQRADRHHRLDGQHRAAISAALPAFLEFAHGSVLVAHNAPFDVGFLKAAAAEQQLPWPAFAVVDTAVLARRVLTRDEVPNCKLSTLRRLLRARHDAEPPRARRRAGHRRRAARADRAARQSRRAVAARAARVHRPGRARGAPQAASRRRHARPARASTSSATRAARRSTSAPAATCAPGCGSTSWPARCAPGWARWSRSPSGSTRSRARTPSRRRCASCG